jgi:aminocarboxymuconate-semialdehyde decarboxylase
LPGGRPRTPAHLSRMVVDAHAHVIVPGLGADVEWTDAGQVVRYGGREIRSALREFGDIPRIVEEQDRAGVDVVVLAPWVNLCGVEVERQNEALASYVGERVWALGTAETADQLVDLMRDGRLSGVEIPAALLGDDAFDDVCSAAEETGALVFVHPSTRGFALPMMNEHYMWNTLGNPFETALNAARFVLSGMADRHPDARILLAHGGGVLPALRGRLAHEAEVHSTGIDVRAAIRRFYVDTVVHDADVLRSLVDFFGADRVLLGSDYPFDMGVERPAEIVRALQLDAGDEAKILGGNAAALLRQERPA